VTGVEALARWTDPEHGEVSPVEFIPLAEETGLIVDLGAKVLRRACTQVAHWRRRDSRWGDLQLAVNVSARQLVHPGFLDAVRTAVAESGTPPRDLTLEITESTLMESAGPAMSAVAELKGVLGVSLAIDDFGTGYSSLAYLTRLPIDGLKVDRAFVHGLGSQAVDTAVVRAVLSLAGNLGLRVTAEGVEDDRQAEHLRSLDCPYAQGFRFSRPLSAAQAPLWLAGTAPPR
jgi:EAL domain-containing protein (putative c-di-GMP-specific phosphodiesterase class I)